MEAVGSSARTKRTPAEKDALAVAASRLHFEENFQHIDIAERLGIRQEEVAGYLRRARQGDLIALRVEDPSVPRFDSALGSQLEGLSGIRKWLRSGRARPDRRHLRRRRQTRRILATASSID